MDYNYEGNKWRLDIESTNLTEEYFPFLDKKFNKNIILESTSLEK